MRRVLVLVTLSVLALPAIARAQAAVTVTLTPAGEALATANGLTADGLAMKIKTEVDNAYDTNNVGKFLRAFGDATSFAQRGIGVDYMSLPHNFMLGIGAQVGVATTDELSLGNRPTTGGAAVNASLMLGLNLADWDLPRWTLFANGFYESGSTTNLEGKITTAGAHIQYRLVEPQVDQGVEATLLRWSGIDITTGIEYTKWSFGAKNDIIQNYNIDNGNGTTTALTSDSVGKFDLASKAATIPIEVTTGLRIALLVSLYAGVGYDLSAGKSTVDGDLTGTLTTADKTNVGTVKITETGSNTSSPGQLRGLAGVQVNLWKLKVYAQANVSQLPAASLGFGLRLVL
jgi:hypothetical protein